MDLNISSKDKIARHILRLGLAITFIWTGLMIIQNPEIWSSFLPQYFLQSEYSTEFTLAVGFFDTIVGFFLVANRWVWFISLLAALHMLGILVTSGVNSITVKDIGLLSMALALLFFNIPHNIKRKVSLNKEENENKKADS